MTDERQDRRASALHPVQLFNGQVDDFDYEETLPKDDAVAVVDHFLSTGELAPWVA